MYKTDTQQLSLSKSFASDFYSGEWDVRGVESGLIEISWAGLVNATDDSTAFLEATGTRVCWCTVSGSTVNILAAEECQGIELRAGHGFSYVRVSFVAGGASDGTGSIVATGKIRPDNGITGGQQ